MELNIEETMAGILDWDFSLVHRGRSVKTRPLTIGDLGRLVAMSSKGKQGAPANTDTVAKPANTDAVAKPANTDAVAKPSEILKSLLAESGPEIDEWVAGLRGEEVYGAINAIAKYSGFVMSKNSPAIDPAIESAMAILFKPSGSSTQA